MVVAGPPGAAATLGVRRRRRQGRRSPLAVLGVVPFFAYVAFFLLIPAVELILDAFRTPAGHFTTANVSGIFQTPFPSAFEYSLEVSALSAVMGGVLGLLVANGVLHHGIPRVLNSLFVSFSGMASNFAGVPLAFAYTSTIGASGVVTALLGHVGVHLPFDFLQTQLGLSLVYLYFQFPLMVLLAIPALQGLRTEWREAAQNLGAGTIAFWRYVGMPVLAPSLLGMVVLLFGSAFSAYATAYALGVSNLVTVQIGNYVNGNTVYDPQMAYALAFGMIVIIAVTMGLYTLLQRRASRWLR